MLSKFSFKILLFFFIQFLDSPHPPPHSTPPHSGWVFIARTAECWGIYSWDICVNDSTQISKWRAIEGTKKRLFVHFFFCRRVVGFKVIHSWNELSSSQKIFAFIQRNLVYWEDMQAWRMMKTLELKANLPPKLYPVHKNII